MKRNVMFTFLCLLAVSTLVGCGGPGEVNKLFGKDASLGELTISLGTAHPGTVVNATVPLGTTADVVMAQIALTADDVEDIHISSITVQAGGSGDDVADLTSLTGVDLYIDINSDGVWDAGDTFVAESSYTSDDGSVNFTLNRTVTKGTTLNLLVLYDFDVSVTAGKGGRTFLISMDPASTTAPPVLATGVTSALEPTISGISFQGITATVAGTLTITRGANDPASANVSGHSSGMVVLQLNLEADVAEGLTITDLTITAGTNGGTPYSPNLDESTEVTTVGLYFDATGDGVFQALGDTLLGTTQVYSTDDGTITFTNIGRTIAGGSNQDWIVVYDLDTNDGGDLFSADLDAASDIVGTGDSSFLQFFRTGSVIGNQFATVQTGVLDVIRGAGCPASNTNVPEGTTGELLLEINLTASAYEDITISSITFTHTGTGVISGASPDDVATFTLYDQTAGSNISSVATVTGNQITFSGLSETITGGAASVNWRVFYDFSTGLTTSGGNTFRLSLAGGADLTATGSLSTPVVLGATIGTTLPIGPSPTVTLIETLEVRRGANSPSNGSIGVPSVAATMEILQLEFIAHCDTVNIASLTLLPSGTGDDQGNITNVRIYEDANGNGTFDTGETVLASGTYPSDDGQQTFSFSSSLTVPPLAANSVFVVVECTFGTAGAAGDTFTVEVRQTDISATGAGSLTSLTPVTPTPPGWPIQGAILNYGATLLIGGTGTTPGTSYTVSRTATSFIIYAFKLTESLNVDDVDVSSITLTAMAGIDQPALLQSHISAVRLYYDANKDGVALAGEQIGGTQTFNGTSTSVTFSGFATDPQVAQLGSEEFIVECDFTGNSWVGCSYALGVANQGDISTTQVTLGGSASITGTPHKGGYQVIEGIWDATPLATVNTAWGASYQTYGIYEHSMIFYPAGGTGGYGSLISTGGLAHDNTQGGDMVTITNGTYELNLNPAAGLTWVVHNPTGTPPGGAGGFHAGGSMVYFLNGTTPSAVYYGGQYLPSTGGSIQLSNNNTVIYDLATPAWQAITVSGTAPSGTGRYRNGFGLDTTVTNPVFYVWGGWNGTAPQNDLTSLTLTWTSATSTWAGVWGSVTTAGTSPTARSACDSAMDLTSSFAPSLLIAGGHGAGTPPLEKTAAQLPFPTTGTPTYAGLSTMHVERTQGFCAWDPEGKQMFSFGGLEWDPIASGAKGSIVLESFLQGCPNATSFPPTRAQWLALANAPTGPGGLGGGRGLGAAAWDSNNHTFIVFGGSNMSSTTPTPNSHRADLNVYILR